MRPNNSMKMRCYVFVRNSMLSTHTSKSNLTLGIFSDMNPERMKLHDQVSPSIKYQVLGKCSKNARYENKQLINCRSTATSPSTRTFATSTASTWPQGPSRASGRCRPMTSSTFPTTLTHHSSCFSSTQLRWNCLTAEQHNPVVLKTWLSIEWLNSLYSTTCC